MKADIKQLLRDLRAAVILGRPEAVNVGLDGLLEVPGVPSNDQMSEGFIEKVVIPVGTTLAGMKASYLRPLLTHDLAVGRAVGGVALAHRYVNASDSTPKDLRIPGNDNRLDVRLALGRSLVILSEADPGMIFNLGTTWMNQPSPRLRYTALIFLPALASQYRAEIFRILATLSGESSREVQSALVRALNHFAIIGFARQVLDLLSQWGSEAHPNSWVICRTLSSSWATSHSAEVKLILRDVKTKTGESNHVDGALKALKRHGLDLEI